MNFFKLKTTFSRMEQLLDSCRKLDTSGEQNLLKTGAKARYLGGGWWSFIGTDQAVGNARILEKLLKCSDTLNGLSK